MNGIRNSLALSAMLVAGLLAGCAGGVSGAPVAAGDGTGTGTGTGRGTAVTTATQPPPDCTEVIHGDPWIVFEWDKDLKDGYELTVGERGFFHGTADGITVGGTGAVTMQEQSAATEIRCDVVTSSVSWVEVVGTAAGDVTFTWDGQPEKTTAITVVAG